MNCETVHRQLDDYLDGRLAPSEAQAFRSHAASCAECARRVARAELLQSQLREMPAPRPAPGYAERVLTGVRRARREQPRRAGWALAACIALGLALAAVPRLTPVSFPPAARVVTVTAEAVQPVKLVFNSPRALDGVTLRIGLPEGVELAGYPGSRELAWQTHLDAGVNVLELPVVVHGRGGVLTASLSQGAERREFSVTLRARRDSSSLSGAIQHA